MLDEFLWGKVSRISPEAPVPVVEIQSESAFPGGAANVARNLRPFCGAVHLCGLMGGDAAAARLVELLSEAEIHTYGLVESPGFSTIVKTRIIARHQQVVRVDRERRVALRGQDFDETVRRIGTVLPEMDAVVLEDYGKGFLTQALKDEVVRLAREHHIIVTADPNPGNPLRWDGVSTLKPNRGEAFALAGRPDPGAEDDPMGDGPLLEVGSLLLTSQAVDNLLITLGEHGMMLFQRGGEPYHTPTRAKEVFDVSGAGDTAIALYTLALCAGADGPEAAEVANHASGVVVGKLGTATLTRDELAASFGVGDAEAEGK